MDYSLRKHPFLLALICVISMEFLSLSRRRSSARNVPSDEERGETDVFAGYMDYNTIIFCTCSTINVLLICEIPLSWFLFQMVLMKISSCDSPRPPCWRLQYFQTLLLTAFTVPNMFRLHLSFQTVIYLKLEIEISNLKCILTRLDCKTVGFFSQNQ